MWRITKRIGCIVLVNVAVFPDFASAGPLSPPPGPVTSTYKTLQEVEPRVAVQSLPAGTDCLYIISAPGSYYLTGNITGVSGKHGIRIDSDNVVLDLAGFSLIGVPGAIDGVTMEGASSYNNIVVMNGTSMGWRDGIAIGNGYNGALTNLHASGNSRHGISGGGSLSMSNCTVRGNGSAGISLYTVCTFTNCSAINNSGPGMQAGSGSTFNGCTSSFNGGHGIVMYITTDPGANSSVVDCTTKSNGGAGIIAEAVFNGYPDRGVLVSRCNASGNSSDGIRVLSNSSVSDCLCQGNGAGAGSGAGVAATGAGNRVEGNHLTDNDWGINVTGTGNFILRNTASGNATNYVAVAGNALLVISAPASGAVNGNSGGAGLGSTDPWANFSF